MRRLAFCFCFAGPGMAQDSFEAVYQDASQKWAQFLGASDACSGRDRKGEIESEAETTAALMHPGLIDRMFGARSDAQEQMAVFMRMAYSTARIAPDCFGADLMEKNWRFVMQKARAEIGDQE